MNRRDMLLSVAATMVCSCAKAIEPSAQAMRYVSLKLLQRSLAGECSHPTCTPAATLSLGGLVSIEGFMIDRREQDIILFGSTQAGGKRPALRTSDWVHAMRSATHRYLDADRRFSVPGVSIDPQPRVVARLMGFDTSGLGADGVRGEQAVKAWGEICEAKQMVRAMGLQREGLRSAYLLNCLIADELLKSIVDGTIDMQGVVVPSQVVLARFKEAFERDAQSASLRIGFSMSRYWLNAGTVRCGVNGDTCLLLQCDLKVSTEAQMFAGRELVDSSKRDELADQCAASITRIMPRMVAEHPVYAELMNIYRTQAIAVSLVRMNAESESGLELEPLLDRWVTPTVEMPSDVPGRWAMRGADLRARLANGYVISRVRIPSCGGVTVNPEPIRERIRLPQTCDLAWKSAAALGGSQRPLYWDVAGSV